MFLVVNADLIAGINNPDLQTRQWSSRNASAEEGEAGPCPCGRTFVQCTSCHGAFTPDPNLKKRANIKPGNSRFYQRSGKGTVFAKVYFLSGKSKAAETERARRRWIAATRK